MTRRTNQHRYADRDVTINDCANSGKKIGRVKKSLALPKGNKCLETVVSEVENLQIDSEDTMAEDNSICLSSNRRRKLKAAAQQSDEHSSYVNYHIDIWHIIAKFIPPEDVGRFALICTKTAYVVQSAQFWTRLYKRYYCRGIEELPMRLQPECMVRLCGLRASAIRSLFYTYEPFVERLQMVGRRDIHMAEKKQLVTMWYEQSSSKLWKFYFKLKCKLGSTCRAAEAEKKRRNDKMLEYLSDVYANSDEGCQMMVISTTSYRQLPQFFGQSIDLASVTQTLCNHFCSYKITLSFASRIGQERVGGVTFDPVVRVIVYDWWMPEYMTICS